MRKSGAGHVEIIVAFILFMGFLFFGLYFFNPLDSNRVLDSTLAYAIDEVNDNATTEGIVYNVVIDDDTRDLIVKVPLSRGNFAGTGVRVEGENGLLNSCADTTGVRFNRGTSVNRLIRVFFSDFPAAPCTLPQGVALVNGQYIVSSSDVKKILSEKELLLLNASYYDNYIDVKKDFNLPGRTDFMFSVRFSDGDEISAKQDLPENVEVYSKTERKEILRTDGRIDFADITVGVW